MLVVEYYNETYLQRPSEKITTQVSGTPFDMDCPQDEELVPSMEEHFACCGGFLDQRNNFHQKCL